MSEKRWVQHISGQGEKWEVENEVGSTWRTRSKMINEYAYQQSCCLPKSEYRLCDPPEEWEDVTGEFSVESSKLVANEIKHAASGSAGIELFGHNFSSHRLVKIDGLHNGPAFIIERKKG